ncbi:hypothetical protein Taro_040801 [Colocasia esculenta]|uniref:Uncharacterized protein n=1 Tax=Colocasia esculenta TaxID=4460 RepID=A0A843WCS0_COLES|nr:hypothetical protein [Colocasia esculenta]
MGEAAAASSVAFSVIQCFVRCGVHARNVSRAWMHRRCGDFHVLWASSAGHMVTEDKLFLTLVPTESGGPASILECLFGRVPQVPWRARYVCCARGVSRYGVYLRVGPFIHDCETERFFSCYVVRVGYWRHEPVVRSRVVASFHSDSCFATGCGLCVVTCWLRFYPLGCALVLAQLWLWFHGGTL